MAAAANKPIGYQVTVGFLSVLLVILLTLVYMDNKNYKLLDANYKKSESDRQKVEADYKKKDDEYQDLMLLTGNRADSYGLGEDGNTATVRGGSLADIRKAGQQAEPTYKAAINKFVQQVAELERERDKQRDDLVRQQATIEALRNEYQQRVDVNDTGRKKAETQLQDLVGKKDEEVRSKQKQIDELRQKVLTAESELENEKAAHITEVKKLNEDIAKLGSIIVRVNEKLDEVTKTSFEVPDGVVRWVDNQNGLVWISLGDADNLPKRTTFSVYTKSHHGVARGSEDIKGSIEVTRITGAHTAEARILKDELYQPITKGDPIFTPLWSPGRTENFSFVGIIDLDGDGKSDRERLHELVAAAGSTVDNEVDDDGTRIRFTKFPTQSVEFGEGVTGIDVSTKFLVVGKIPEHSEAATQEDKDKIERIQKHLKALRTEAQQQGVRIVNLSDFLSWIGYQPQRRLFQPGNEKGYVLKAGQRAAPVDEVSRTSGAVSGNMRIKPQTSTGTVSGQYKGGPSK